MRLRELLDGLDDGADARISGPDGAGETIVRGISYDSRAVAPGDLFVALRGTLHDGHDYLEQAIRLGAAALVVERVPERTSRSDAIFVQVHDARRALAPLARRFFGDPAAELELIGITGTNGKTSTTYLVESILGKAGRRVGLLGTVEIRHPGQRIRAVNTTPESLDLQRTLRAMRTNHVDAVVMEVSSHGLELGRVAGCRFLVAAVTNLTPEHLDFHRDMDAYLEAKLRLFRDHLRAGATAVVNLDDPRGEAFVAAARQGGARVLTTRSKGEADVSIEHAEITLEGTRARLRLAGAPLDLAVPLLGEFNLENVRVAVTVALALGVAPQAIAAGVAACPQVPGRLERVQARPGAPTVLVDYAHTPDAVEKLLRTVRPLAGARLITVFGCGGDRDRSKRPLMARAVARYSDRAVATSDNPRTEDPLAILAQVEAGLDALRRVEAAGLDAAAGSYCVEPDRRTAIQLAIAIARPEDTVVIAGKGHEDYQIVGRDRLPFDDRREARRALEARGGGVIAWLTVADVVRASGGELLCGDPEARLAGVSIDTRTLSPGFAFFAIRGPQHDAHRFLADAVAAGAAALVIEDAAALPAGRPAGLAVVRVDDTTRALGAVAADHRARFTGPLVAITGSNGKTTTKEMCAAILEQSGPCLRTRGNLNNAYGLPLTLLSRRPEDRTAVVELGMNHRGEIAALAAIARPTVGVVTNVGTAHIEYLGSREEIAHEKADLLATVPPEGTAVLFWDDPLLRAEAARVRARQVRFGLGPEADVRAERIERPEPGWFAFELVEPGGRRAVRVAGLHEGTVPNALAAAAAARAAGATLDHVVAGLAAYRPAPGRMNLRALPGDVWLIDDTYNANPQSMAAALRGLADVRGPGRTLAVLGDMGELGEAAPEAHREAGRLAARLGVDRLVVVGAHAREVLAGAREAGLPAEHAVEGKDAEDAVARVGALRPHDRVLVKGSRSMRMERVVAGLAARSGEA